MNQRLQRERAEAAQLLGVVEAVIDGQAMELALGSRESAIQGQWDKAAADFAKAIELSDGSPTLRNSVADWCEQLAADQQWPARPESSEKLLRYTIALLEDLAEDFPDRPDYRERIAGHYGKLGRTTPGQITFWRDFSWKAPVPNSTTRPRRSSMPQNLSRRNRISQAS